MKSISRTVKLLLVVILGLGILLPAAAVTATPMSPLKINPGGGQVLTGQLLLSELAFLEGSASQKSPARAAASKDKEGSGKSQGEAVITGTVTSILSDTWKIGSTIITVTQDTEIQQGLAVGSVVKVEGERLANGGILAEEIKAFTPKPPNENDLNEDQNDNEQGDEDNQAAVVENENDNEDNQVQETQSSHKSHEGDGGGDHEGDHSGGSSGGGEDGGGGGGGGGGGD